jgi:PKD repeat protein
MVTITVNSVNVNGLVGLPDGLEACASANPMAANGTYTLRITGTPTTAGEYPLNMRAEIDGELNIPLVQMSAVNNYTNGENGVSTNITITVVEAGDMAANFSTNPSATGVLTQAVHITEGGTVAFTDLSTGADHIAWSFEGGSPATSTSANVTVTYATAGSYTATLTAYNSDESQNDTKSVSIEVEEASAAPIVFTVDFTADNTTITTGQTVNFTNLTTATQNNEPYSGEIFYKWNFDADNILGGLLGGTSTDINASYTYETAGVYSVSLAASNSEISLWNSGTVETKEAYITVTDTESAVEENAIDEISVYPNPTNSIINIAAEGMQNITIIDMTGRVVMSKDVNSNFETIDAEGFAKANYMVRIATADGVVVKNIVVE